MSIAVRIEGRRQESVRRRGVGVDILADFGAESPVDRPSGRQEIVRRSAGQKKAPAGPEGLDRRRMRGDHPPKEDLAGRRERGRRAPQRSPPQGEDFDLRSAVQR